MAINHGGELTPIGRSTNVIAAKRVSFSKSAERFKRNDRKHSKMQIR